MRFLKNITLFLLLLYQNVLVDYTMSTTISPDCRKMPICNCYANFILTYSKFSDATSVLLSTEDYQVHDVTGTLKLYLRELPEPVIPATSYSRFIDVSRKSCVLVTRFFIALVHRRNPTVAHRLSFTQTSHCCPQ